ncbi:hypothetical protein KY348_02230 [Candidatus Woesearchaeota archaeon]|nr:hypothetical protein [Candidatus Woesearchaeota archaeon]
MHSSTKKQLLNTMVLKEHIYEDIAELEVEVTFIDGGEEHKMVEIFSSPLVLENGEWKFYGKAKKVCYDDESCYFNNNDCFNSKWSKIKDFELISFDPGNHDKICHCGRYSECVLQDISGKRCSSDEDCYYHVGYDSCFNEAHFKEQKWEMITAHPENPSITCSCTDTLCTRVDIDNQT